MPKTNLTISTFEIPGGIRAHWHRYEASDGWQRMLVYQAGGQKVCFDCPQGFDGESLQEGQLVSPLSWFWNVDDGWEPIGAYASQAEAQAAAEHAFELCDSDERVKLGAAILELFPEHYETYNGHITRAEILKCLLLKELEFEIRDLDDVLQIMTEANLLARTGDSYECLLP
jgi:hypothetical protein